MKLTLDDVRLIAAQFAPHDDITMPEAFGGGHINDSYLFCQTADLNTRCVLQRINKNVFPHPEQVMDNMLRVTEYMRAKLHACGGDCARGALQLLQARDGRYYHVDANGDYWRSYRFVPDSICYDRSGDEGVFCQTGHAFGRFLKMLDGFDAASLHETIARFHDTPKRFGDFREAIRQDRMGRAKDVQAEIAQALSYEGFAGTLVEALGAGDLPLRVTHNDTKLNNVLIDQTTGLALCVIDMDTVMPGLCAYDFGDAIRYGASTAAEDETDLSKVHFSMPMYRAYAQGYLSEVRDILTSREVDSLPEGAKMMTLENAIRFLGDYLNGDVYFKIAYPTHNLDRARTQLKLLADMDAHWDEMLGCIRELGAKRS